jgi:hypothetical protein
VTNPQDRIAQVWNDAVGQHIGGLSQDDYDAMVARFRPQATPAPAVDESNLPITRRSGFAAKCGQLADLTANCGPNGHQGIGHAAAAFEPAQPQPQPEVVAHATTYEAQPGFKTNRAQGSSGNSDWVPETSKDRNNRIVNEILQRSQP